MVKPTCLHKVGDAVSYDGGSRKEYGRIISITWDKNYQWYDCRVAFYGHKWPADEDKAKKKYVLRYFDSSLERYYPPKRK